MANPRKVQQEIDKLLKKVSEGIDVYDATFEKVNSAPDRVQKEKFEAELKKEIKKLQRLREQIKNLHASPEVKDKKALEQNRRAIEVKMEGFKVCERETKTKAFSKEGLATNKTDPAARAKAKTTSWIRDAIQELQDQIEQLEFDIENDGPKKGKKGGGDEREDRMKRNQYHILKLEAILRVLEMGELEPEDVDEIEPEVREFVEGFQDSNYEEDDTMDIYEMFDIPEGMVQAIGTGHAKDEESDEEPSAPAAAPPKKEVAKAKETPPQKVAPKPAAKKAPAEPAPKKQPSPAVPAKAAPVPAAVTPKTPITPLSAKTAASPGQPVKSMADIVAGNTKRAEPEKKPEPPKPSAKEAAPAAAPAAAPPANDDALLDDDDNNDDTFGDDALDGVTPGGGTLADLASMTAAKNVGGDWAKPLPATVAGTAATANPLANAPKLPPAAPAASGAKAPQPAAPQPQLALPSQQASSPTTAAPTTAAATVAAAAAAAGMPAPQAQPAPQPAAPAAPTGPRPSASEVIQKMLNVSLQNLPHTSDCERPKPYNPPNPYQTPDYYPQTVHSAFNFPETFVNFDVDTLFFIFYYQQASYQQYLAAKELKRQSWRFHKKYQTWFQRHERPKVTNEDHEQGTYVYFDYEAGWCQRVKADFIFKYSQLEDSLV